jgi:PAS domain-containing protein
MNKIDLATEGIACGIHPRIFRSKPVGDICLDIAKFAEDRDCRTLEYLLKLAAADAYECLDQPIDPPAQLKSFGMWDWDVSSNLVYADATTAKLFGVDPEKSRTGLDLHNFEVNIYSDDVPKYSSTLYAAAQNGGGFEARYRIVANGNLTWVYAKGSCLLSKNYVPTRFPGALIEM